MRGRSHLIIGTLASIEVAILTNTTITPIHILCATFLSCAPDIDESNSKISNTYINKKHTRNLYNFIILFLVLIFSYYYSNSSSNFYTVSTFSIISILIIKKFFSENILRKIVISSTLMLIASTLYLYDINIAVILLLILISLFPLFKHRGMTHSIFITIIIFLVLRFIETKFELRNLSIVGSAAYLVHLFSDLITKRGIPIFYPFSNKYTSLANFKVGSITFNLIENLIILLMIISTAFTIISMGIKFGLY